MKNFFTCNRSATIKLEPHPTVLSNLFNIEDEIAQVIQITVDSLHESFVNCRVSCGTSRGTETAQQDKC
jgi:hypothetical protein